jgi:hypothetical protein
MRKRSNDKNEREREKKYERGRWSSSYARIDLSIGLKCVWCLPAFRGRGTPPTKTVLRGSSGREASRTKSASDNFHGLICTGLSCGIKNGEMS